VKLMPVHALVTILIVLCGMSMPARASNPGDACTIPGAQERTSGQILTCNGTTWVETIQTVNAGRSLFQIGLGTLKFTAVDNIADSVCAIGNGDLYCWGDGAAYQLGNGIGTPVYVPTKIGTDKWQALSVDGSSAEHHCGIKPDRTLWCWGGNTNTQLGDNTYVNVPTPTNISGANTWLMIAPEQFSTCGIRMSGALYCWGTDASQQLGNGAAGTTGTPTLIGTASWKWVSTGPGHTCGIQSDDSLWCWGSNTAGRLGDGVGSGTYNVPTKIGTDSWKSVSLGSNYTCGIKMDNTLWCWGAAGNHGDGTNANKNAPVQIGGAQWLKIAAGGLHACGIQVNGTLWCWGSENWNSETSFASSANRLTATQVGVAKWTDISAGFRFTCGIQADSTLWCWGQNPEGQLGRGTTSAYSGTVTATAASTSGSTTCQSYEEGRMRFANSGSILAPTTSGLVGYWTMDETSGTTVADSSGNGNNGTMVNMDGNTDHVPGMIGNGLDFDGTNDYVNAGSGASLDDIGDMSACVWSYARPILNGNFATVLYKYDPSGQSGWDMYYGGAAHSNGNSGGAEPTQAVLEGWNHFCVVNTDTGDTGASITLYVNGVVNPDNGFAWGNNGNDAAYNLIIGAGGTTPNDPFNGILDEVRVYNRPLTANEVQTIFNYNGSTAGTAWQYCNGANWVDF